MDTFNYEDLVKMDPLVFLGYLNTFQVFVPETVDDWETAKIAAELLSKAANNFTYMNSLLGYMAVRKRQCKSSETKEQKALYGTLVDKVEAIEATISSIQTAYRAISKMLSLYSDNRRELLMTGELSSKETPKWSQGSSFRNKTKTTDGYN